jgi:zinc transport system substrate-binding protein
MERYNNRIAKRRERMKFRLPFYSNKSLVLSYLLCLVTIFFVLSLNSWGGNPSAETLTAYVVNYPLKYFAERIAGDHAKVVFPAPSEGDPAYWMPDAETVAAYQKADLILLNGANYA